MEKLIHFLMEYLELGGKDALENLCKFTGVTRDTIREWANNKYAPKGMNLVKLRYCLDFQGYEIDELTAMPEIVYDLGLLIAHGHIDISDTAKILGYMGDAADSLLRVFRAGKSLPDEKTAKAKAILSDHEKNLRELKSQKKIAKKVPENGAKIDIQVQQAERRVISNTEIQEDAILLQNMENVSKLLAPRLKKLLANGTPDMRRRLREIIGAKQIFDLSNTIFHMHETISMLCSEKSLEIKKLKKETN